MLCLKSKSVIFSYSMFFKKWVSYFAWLVSSPKHLITFDVPKELIP